MNLYDRKIRQFKVTIWQISGHTKLQMTLQDRHSVIESQKIRKIEVSLTQDSYFPSVKEISFFCIVWITNGVILFNKVLINSPQ